MRLIVIGLTMALAASAPLGATAQAPVTTQPLAQGEVLLEVNALGLVTTRADRATMTFAMSGAGADEAEARANAERILRESRAMLHAQGVTDADIHVQPITSYEVETAMANAMDMADMNATMAAPDPMAPSAGANVSVDIVVRNVDRVPAIQEALTRQGYAVLSAPTYTVADDRGSRARARAQALQKARADAEAYASALNLRVVRIVRVTERLGLDLLSMAASETPTIARIFSPEAMRGNTGPDVPSMVVVGVDFALAPR